MPIKINTIITLENQMRYVVLNEANYEDKKYFLVMQIDTNKEVIPTNVAIIEEFFNGVETYIEKVKDPELIITLTNLLKTQI